LNHDGKLSKEEFMAPQKDKAESEKRFMKFDKDRDGNLNQEEFVNQGK
jgi:Ca2+-binding EF-hand superfamily protein